MKWFTKEYMASEAVDRTVWNEYQAYIQTIKDQLPGNLSNLCDFSEGWNGHTQLPDGNIRSITISLDEQFAVIEMDAGYWFVGNWKGIPFTKEKGRRVWLRYFGVSEYKLTNERLGALPDLSLHGDHAFDEIEMISAGVFQHRMYFHNGSEIVVTFRDFRLDYENLE